MPGAEPSKWTKVNLTLFSSCSFRKTRCSMASMPVVPILTSPGFALAASMRSLMLLYLLSALTAMAMGSERWSATGARLLRP